MKKTFDVTEETYLTLVKHLTARVQAYCKQNDWPTYLIAVARGGLIPAQYIAYQMGIPQVYSIGLYSYDGKKQQKIQPYQALPIFDIEQPVFLIVDNLVDSGNTLSFVTNHLNDLYPNCKCISATIFKKNEAKYLPHIFVREVEQNIWIEFPYEPKDT